LARNCLSHPAAAGRGVFWNAEVSTEADSADRSLACVVVPAWRAEVPLGLLGVVDTWLPEPDLGQREALVALAREVGDVGATGEGHGDVDDLWCVIPEARLAPPFSPGAAPGTHEGDAQTAERAFPPADPASVTAVLGSSPDPVAAVSPNAAPSALDVLKHLPDAVVVTRWDGTIVLANERFGQLVGRHAGELSGCNIRPLVSSGAGGIVGAAESTRGDGRPLPARRLSVSSPSGARQPVTATDVRIEGTDAEGVAGPWFVTVLRPAPSADSCSAASRIESVDLVSNLDDGLLCLDAAGTVALSNQAADRFHGLPAGQSLVGAPLPEVGGLRTEDGDLLAPDAHPGLVVLREGAPCTAHLVLGPDEDRQQHVTVSARPFIVDGGRGALVVLRDSTTEWLEQRRLTQYALYDPLTGLANRYLLLEELRRMLLLLGRQGGAVALVYLDLDGFKRINDEHGHDVGDEVLAAVARRLRGAVRSDDVVSRLGGDEFVIAHASAERLPDGDLVVSRLRKVLSAPFRVRSQAFDVGASIGWVSTDRGEEGPEALLAKADRAMYLQKRNRASARRSPA
jgi:diguanylate cyclase (GGDEF)-like protein